MGFFLFSLLLYRRITAEYQRQHFSVLVASSALLLEVTSSLLLYSFSLTVSSLNLPSIHPRPPFGVSICPKPNESQRL